MEEGRIRSACNASEQQQIDAGITSEQASGGPRSAHFPPAAPGQAQVHLVAPRSPVDFQVAVVAAAQILEVAEIRADLFRHSAQQAQVQRLRHGFVNLAQP